jgi:peptide subunit release factor 1 (eRF1)
VEARVETLLVEDDLATPGVECPACGWLGPPGRESCPADGTPTERREDVIEAALGRLVEQDAALVSLHEREDLQPFGGIGAVLRF